MSVMRMVRWLGGVDHGQSNVDGVIMTDDPLAAVIGPKATSSSSISRPCSAFKKKQKEIYSVSRINPCFVDNVDCTSLAHKASQLKHQPPEATAVQLTPSSGYGSHGGSSHEPIYTDTVKLREDAVAILEQNASFVKSILVAVKNKSACKGRRSVGSLGSSAAGTLSTIPEGKVDFTIPRPIWPKADQNLYDSLVDESLLLYTSLSYLPELEKRSNANEILKDITETINLSKAGQMNLSPEQILKLINDKLISNRDRDRDREMLQQEQEQEQEQTTEDEMRRLSVNLRNSDKLNSVIRAFGSTSSACTPPGGEWTDIYQVPSSSSGYSENALPVFVHEDLSTVPNGLRNTLIYGTLCKGVNERLLGAKEKPKGSLLAAAPDAKPSVWEIYYGAALRDEERGDYNTSGRPEADFTLDVPRSELLSRRMKSAKKWRFRCRIVTSFLGLVFFLLSLMAVSLMLTRGKRMFGSMV